MLFYFIGGAMVLVGGLAYFLWQGKVGGPVIIAGAILIGLKVTGALAAEKPPLPKPSPIVTAAKVKRQAATIWPALSQREVDDVAMRAKALGKGVVNIFCYNEDKCGELASSLENAFETAKWNVAVRYTASMIPPGLLASPKVIKTLATIDPHFGLGADPEPEPVESISIGERPDPKSWKE